jgi:hypothetical protein
VTADPERIKEEVSPFIASGLTSDEDEDREQYAKSTTVDGETTIRQVSRVRYLEGTRVPIAVFVCTQDDDTIWVDGVHDDRVQRGAIISFPPDVVEAMRLGYICIRCQEPHPDPFPLACSLCGFNMKELQAPAFASEFEGETQLGPSKPLQEYVDRQRLESEKKAFEKKLAGGSSPMRGLNAS